MPVGRGVELDLESLEVELLLEGIYRRYGYDFREYAPASLRRRLRRRMDGEKVASVSALQERVALIHRQSRNPAIAEQYIAGRELYMSIIGNDRLKTFTPWELIMKRLPEGVPNIATSRLKWSFAHQTQVGLELARKEQQGDGAAEARHGNLGRRETRDERTAGLLVASLRVSRSIRRTGEMIVHDLPFPVTPGACIGDRRPPGRCLPCQVDPGVAVRRGQYRRVRSQHRNDRAVLHDVQAPDASVEGLERLAECLAGGPHHPGGDDRHTGPVAHQAHDGIGILRGVGRDERPGQRPRAVFHRGPLPGSQKQEQKQPA